MLSQFIKVIIFVTLNLIGLPTFASASVKRTLFMPTNQITNKFLGYYYELGEGQKFRALKMTLNAEPMLCEGSYQASVNKVEFSFEQCSFVLSSSEVIEADVSTTRAVDPALVQSFELKQGTLADLIEGQTFRQYTQGAAVEVPVKLTMFQGTSKTVSQQKMVGGTGDIDQLILSIPKDDAQAVSEYILDF